jgi:hypothetical protein
MDQNQPTSLREKFFSKLASIRKQDKEKKNSHELIKRLMKQVVAKTTA